MRIYFRGCLFLEEGVNPANSINSRRVSREILTSGLNLLVDLEDLTSSAKISGFMINLLFIRLISFVTLPESYPVRLIQTFYGLIVQPSREHQLGHLFEAEDFQVIQLRFQVLSSS